MDSTSQWNFNNVHFCVVTAIQNYVHERANELHLQQLHNWCLARPQTSSQSEQGYLLWGHHHLIFEVRFWHWYWALHSFMPLTFSRIDSLSWEVSLYECWKHKKLTKICESYWWFKAIHLACYVMENKLH